MYMFQSEFEEAAIKAYHEDPWTTDSEDGEQDKYGKYTNFGGSKNIQNEGGEVELSDRNEKDTKDIQYDGGSSSKASKK